MWTHSSRCPGLQPEPCPTCRPSCPQGPKGSQGSPELPSTYGDLSKPLAGLQLSHQKTMQPETKGQVKTKDGVFPQEPGHRPGQTSRQAASYSAHSAEQGSVPCPTRPRPQGPDWAIPNRSGDPSQAHSDGQARACSSWPQLLLPCKQKTRGPPLPQAGSTAGGGREPGGGATFSPPGWTQASGSGPSTAGVTPAGRVGLER